MILKGPVYILVLSGERQVMADHEVSSYHRNTHIDEHILLKPYSNMITVNSQAKGTDGDSACRNIVSSTNIEQIFQTYNGDGACQEECYSVKVEEDVGKELLKFENEKVVPEVNSVAVASKIGMIIQNLGIAESNSDIPSWAKSLIMALGEATTELQYISTDQTEKTRELQTTITEQSIKINQLEERCHIQEFLMKILQEEKELLSERIQNFEVQMKKHKKEKKIFMERTEQLGDRHEVEKKEYIERIEQLEAVFEEHKSEKTLLLDKIDTFEASLQNNKGEKESLLEKIDSLESALDDAMIYIKKNCLLSRESQQPVASDKGLDRNADKEAVRNFIHNMLHKDKLSKLI